MPLFTGNDSDGVVATANTQHWVTLAAELVYSTGAAFDFSTFLNVDYFIKGTVLSDNDAIVSDETSSSNRVIIAEGAFVYAESDGIELRSTFAEVLNNGEIVADGDAAIQLFRSDSQTDGRVTNNGTLSGYRGIVVEGGNVVVNTGLITAVDTGVEMDSNGSTAGASAANTLTNTGTITGNNHGVEIGSVVDAVTRIFNSGTIAFSGQEPGDAIEALSASGAVQIENTGTIIGDVVLGGGDDIINSRHGAIFGQVRGRAGDDTYIVDDPDIALVELDGEGTDLVKAASSFTLGDNFENLTLLGGGNHRGVGNDLANTITGNPGDNVLGGRLGDDTVSGGDGDDLLYGGGGSDSLVGDDGQDTLRGGFANDRLVGGGGDDRLLGGNGNDRLNGNNGDDVLIGGLGKDVLFGQNDADSFVFTRVLDSTVGTTRDQIKDFSAADGDLIDLSAIDADANTGADDAFTFIGNAAYSGIAGELRFTSYVTNSIIRGDVDGDGVDDFQIAVAGVTTLSVGDFVL